MKIEIEACGLLLLLERNIAVTDRVLRDLSDPGNAYERRASRSFIMRRSQGLNRDDLPMKTAERFREVDTVILPSTSVDTQGPHMPALKNSIIVGEEVARRVGEITGAAVHAHYPLRYVGGDP